jgi:methionine-rich copper-binding protein CopC
MRTQSRTFRLRLAAAGLAAIAVLAAAACDSEEPATPTRAPVAAQPTIAPTAMPKDDAMAKDDAMMDDKKDDDAMMVSFPDQRFAAHFVSSTPAHGTDLASAPESVTIKFDFTLGGNSSASLLKDGKAVSTPPAQIAADKLSMLLALPAGAEHGLYTVDYNACWPDGSCHKGLFAFHVGDAMMSKDGDAMTDKDGDAMTDKDGDAMTDKDGAMMDKMGDQKFAAHFVDSVPKHGESYAAAPAQVVINFDFTLGANSVINVSKDGAALAAGATNITGANKLSMNASLPAGSGDGIYTVTYRACWPDGSCHDGEFGFKVDGKLASGYTSMTGKPQVAIAIKDVAFGPQTVVVSKGTTVTWTNQDPFAHFVNTDPHPTHNHTPALNSLELGKDATYSFTFNQAGEYPYHCSAHTNMTARVLVVN